MCNKRASYIIMERDPCDHDLTSTRLVRDPNNGCLSHCRVLIKNFFDVARVHIVTMVSRDYVLETVDHVEEAILIIPPNVSSSDVPVSLDPSLGHLLFILVVCRLQLSTPQPQYLAVDSQPIISNTVLAQIWPSPRFRPIFSNRSLPASSCTQQHLQAHRHALA